MGVSDLVSSRLSHKKITKDYFFRIREKWLKLKEKNYLFKNALNVIPTTKEENICKDQTYSDLSAVLPVKLPVMHTLMPTKIRVSFGHLMYWTNILSTQRK